MSDRPTAPRRRRRQTVRRVRVNPLLNGVDRVDWKDVDFLREFLGDRAKIAPRRVSRAGARAQRQIRIAIKRARQMALLPYE
ncbi:MAG: 30S ribosomal protein S18 [Acidobacteriota bacterium]|nr:30S ribosomal protein S18 [Acidobacteriota bacterium]